MFLALVLLCIALAIVGLIGLRLYRVRQSAVRLLGDVRKLSPSELLDPNRAGLSADMAQTLRMDIETLDRDLRAVRRVTGWIVDPMARQSWWPLLSRLGLLIQRGGEGAVDLTETAWWTALAVESNLENAGRLNLATGMPFTPEADPTGAALKALAQNRERLLRARDALEDVQAAFPAVEALLGTRYQRLEAYLNIAPLGLDALLLMPHVASPDRETKLLLLIQNNEELRPTGGFISSVALITLQGHRLTDVSYASSYDIEAYHAAHPPAPPALQEHMQAGVLLFRDANWSPDFPTSAQVLAALYEIDAGERVDVIVALDIAGAQALLSALEPLPIPGYEVTLTADTLMATVVEFWERPLGAASIDERQVGSSDWWQHRKDFGAALLQAGLARIRRLSAADVQKLALTIREAAATKHLLVWALENEILQSDLRRMGWDGRLAETPHDFLMIVDANVGWNKADRYIDRGFDYQVVLDGERPKARLMLTYHHRSTARISECVHEARYEDSYDALANQCYWNYVRVFVPRGSNLVRADGGQGEVNVAPSEGRLSFGQLILVPPGETRTLELEYLLPSGIGQTARQSQRYELLVQKQPGVQAIEAAVHVRVTSQGDVSYVTEGWHSSLGPVATKEETIVRDTRFELAWSPPKE
ncbi:MAG: DUF4012 domain-containing protein [Anaerolineae bacterium]|nr:DUF4012 domain-containing protein [Anaerolineae bacterium]